MLEGLKPAVVYCNQVDLSENSGQGTHERELGGRLASSRLVQGIYVGQKPMREHCGQVDGSYEFIELTKKNLYSYILYQIKLFRRLWKVVRGRRGDGYKIVLYMRYSPTMLAPAIVSIIAGVPMVVRTGPVVRNLSVYGKSRNSFIMRKIVFFLSMINYRIAARIVTVTETIKNTLAEQYSIKPDKFCVIKNGFSQDVFYVKKQVDVRERLGFERDDYIVGYVGSMYKDSGVDDLAKAIFCLVKHYDLKNIKCLLVGDGPVLRDVRKEVERSDMAGHFCIKGRVPYAKVCDYMNVCDVLVAPFNRGALRETGSSALKLYEYLACGKPIIASRHSDHQFIEEHDLGSLFEAENIDELCETITALHNRKFTVNDVIRRREYVISNCSWDRVYENVVDLCCTVLNVRYRA